MQQPCFTSAINEDRGESAVARGRAAGQRAAELRARRERLKHGDPVTEQDASGAHDAAALSRAKDVTSSLRAAEGHRSAAEVHRRVAESLEQAGHDEQAAWHRERADVDDAASRDDDETAVREARQ